MSRLGDGSVNAETPGKIDRLTAFAEACIADGAGTVLAAYAGTTGS